MILIVKKHKNITSVHLRAGGCFSYYLGLNTILFTEKNTYVNTTQMVQVLTVSATLIYKSSPDYYLKPKMFENTVTVQTDETYDSVRLKMFSETGTRCCITEVP